MKKFKLEFACENDAFEDDQLIPEIQYILVNLSQRIDGTKALRDGNIHDRNGNLIGKWRITNAA